MKIKSKKRGYALICVLIVMLPLLFTVAALLELALTDFKISSNVMGYQQSLYNREAGIECGVKKLQLHNYDKNFTGYNLNKYIFFDSEMEISKSGSYSETNIELFDGRFFIHAKGIYQGIANNSTLEINKEELLNLRRKFITSNITVSNGRVNFKIPSYGFGSFLSKYEKILINNTGIDANTNIYTFTGNQNVSEGVKTTEDKLFCFIASRFNKLPTINTSKDNRGQWMSYGTAIKYYVAKKGENITIDINSIETSNESFFKGLREYNGNLDGDNHLKSNYVRIIFTEDDLIIRGFQGYSVENIITNSKRYLENFIVYTTGKITLQDCDLYDYNKDGTTDINIALISEELDFCTENIDKLEGNIISYMDENSGLILNNEFDIINLIKTNTSRYSNWIMGY